jgi:hypothetical protein
VEAPAAGSPLRGEPAVSISGWAQFIRRLDKFYWANSGDALNDKQVLRPMACMRGGLFPFCCTLHSAKCNGIANYTTIFSLVPPLSASASSSPPPSVRSLNSSSRLNGSGGVPRTATGFTGLIFNCPVADNSSL